MSGPLRGLAVAALLAACGDGSAAPSGRPPIPPATASDAPIPTMAAPLACGVAGELRCAGPGSLRECLADGTTRDTPCAATETCLGTACVTLTDPDGTTPDADSIRSLSDEGFLNAWSGAIGVGAEAGEQVLETSALDAIGAPGGLRPVCADDGYVVPIRAANTKRGDTSVAVLTGVLYSDAAREIAIRAGTTGKLTLRIGAETATFEELPGRQGRAWPDERTVRMKLPKGASWVTAVAEPRASAFYLRLREPDGARPRGLAWRERVASAACSAGALLNARASLEVRPEAMTFASAPRFDGVVPRTIPAAFTLTVRTGGKVSTSTNLPLEIGALGSIDSARVDHAIALPEKGAFEVRAELGPDTVFSRTLPSSTPDLARRAIALEKARAGVASDGHLDAGSRSSFERQVDLVSRAVAEAEPDVGWVRRNADVAEKLLPELAAVRDPYRDRKGIVMRAYRSPLDGRLQPYVIFVPRSYDPKRPAPVVLVAHGRDRLPEHALRTLVGQAPDEHMTLSFAAHNLPPMPDFGAILVAPYGYDDGSVLGLGEADAQAILDDLGRAYDLDRQRISLTGYSLGGTVSFLYPLHAPGTFSASAPLCGYPNLMDYQSVARVDKAPWEPALLGRKYVVEYAENGQYVPLHVVHGGKDVPGRSKVVVDRYRELGYSVIFDVPEDADHNVWDDAYENGKMIPWLAAKRTPVAPSSVHLVTRDYRYDRAFWVRIVRMPDSTGTERAEVLAHWNDEDGAIELTTKNVSALALDLDRLDPRPSKPVTIRLGAASAEAPASGVVRVTRADDGTISAGPDAPITTRVKHHDLSGSLDDLMFHPVTVVIGTAEPRLTEANRVLGEHLSRLAGLADVRYPTIDDRDAGDEALAGRSIVLVGDPRSNTLTRALVDAHAVPLEMSESRVAIGAAVEEAGSDLGVAFVFPRPEAFHGDGLSRVANDRYVAVYAGQTPEATLAARMLPRYLPDFVVFDASIASRRGGLLMEDRKVRRAGFFSERWD